MRNIGVTGSSRRSYPQFTAVTASQVIPDEKVVDPFLTKGKGRDKSAAEENHGGQAVSRSIRHSTADLRPQIVVNLTRDTNNIVRGSFTRERSSMPADQKDYLQKEMNDMIKVSDQNLGPSHDIRNAEI